jgi:tRNA pseudouridine65 synthase
MTDSPLNILFQDEHFVAVDKPSGLLVHRSFLDKHETQFAMQTVRDQIGQHVYPVHRLDRATSGVLLFALSSDCANRMMQQFSEHKIVKRYLALSRGFAPEYKLVDKALKYQPDKKSEKWVNEDKEAQDAVTEIRCLQQASLPISLGKFPSVRYSLVECFPKTGRKHQIRRHLNHLAHPIINDVNHGDNTQNHFFKAYFGYSRLMLVAKSMVFNHPYTCNDIHIEAPLGEQLLSTFAQLGWSSNETDYV